MSEDSLSMVDLITESDKHLLWKDEIGDTFLLFKWGEIFRSGKEVLRLYVFSTKLRATLLQMGVVWNDYWTEDGFYVIDVKNDVLPFLMAQGRFKRRPQLNGAWLKRMKKRLAHDIIPYRPVLRV